MYDRYVVCGYCLCGVFRDAGKSVDLDDHMPNPRLSDKRLKELDNAKFDRLVTEAISRKCQRWIWDQSVESVWLSTEIACPHCPHVHLGNNVHISHVHDGNNPQDDDDMDLDPDL